MKILRTYVLQLDKLHIINIITIKKNKSKNPGLTVK
jgi:hypothetical protein